MRMLIAAAALLCTTGVAEAQRAPLPDRRYGAGYDVPGYDEPLPPPQPSYDEPLPPPSYYDDAPGPIVTASNGAVVHSETRVTGGDYYADGYYYPAATTTTITIENPDCGETTKTEYVTERVTRRARPTKLLRRKPSKLIRR